jgi:hypothetical protein
MLCLFVGGPYDSQVAVRQQVGEELEIEFAGKKHRYVAHMVTWDVDPSRVVLVHEDIGRGEWADRVQNLMAEAWDYWLKDRPHAE